MEWLIAEVFAFVTPPLLGDFRQWPLIQRSKPPYSPMMPGTFWS